MRIKQLLKKASISKEYRTLPNVKAMNDCQHYQTMTISYGPVISTHGLSHSNNIEAYSMDRVRCVRCNKEGDADVIVKKDKRLTFITWEED